MSSAVGDTAFLCRAVVKFCIGVCNWKARWGEGAAGSDIFWELRLLFLGLDDEDGVALVTLETGWLSQA